jgi:DNA-binding beta-propeller fold protein YncE
MASLGAGASGQQVAKSVGCLATPSTMTPRGWSEPLAERRDPFSLTLGLVADVELTGSASRFDYQSLDAKSGRLYISHMGAGRVVVFDTKRRQLIKSISGFPTATGILAVPELHRVFVSVAGRHEVDALDDRTFEIVGRTGGVRFPDGIAYVPDVGRIFVSDESGGVDVVIDARTSSRIGTIDLGGEAGNTRYDSVSHCVLVAVQAKNELVGIDPASHRIVARYSIPCQGPHGFLIDEPGRFAYVTCEGNARLVAVDLRTMLTGRSFPVGRDPDVLALDAGLGILYVASEEGVVSIFDARQKPLRPVGVYRAPKAHSVAVNPSTHEIYLPLASVAGHPVLRILTDVKLSNQLRR